METIPAWYWMVIVGALTALTCVILYYIAMLVKESTRTIVEVRETITDSRKIIQASTVMIEDAASIVAGVKGSVEEFNKSAKNFLAWSMGLAETP